MIRSRLAVLVLAAVASCTERTERPVAKAPTAPATLIVPAIPAPASANAAAATPGDPSGLDGDANAVAFRRDGTLVVATDKEVVTLDPGGTIRRKPTSGREARLVGYEEGEGLVLEGSSDVVLLETPSLRELFSGDGAVLTTAAGAIMTRAAPPSVVMQIEGKLARFTLPPGPPKRVDRVDVVSGGKLAVVTWAIEDTMDTDAAVFEAATGRLIGRALSMSTMADPRAAISGDTQYGVEKGSVVVIDLKTAAVVRSAKIACPKNSFLGNPLPSPAGDRLLVTCGDDGIALDPRTLAQRKRYTKIIPGCDNGQVLPALYDAKKPSELVIEGCGGEARLDLGTGVYRCSDDIGLVGAPYDIGFGGQPRARRAPAGRENLARCTSQEQASATRLGTSGTYSLVYGEKPTLTHAGGKIELAESMRTPAISPDESKLAYVDGKRVIVRRLPGGEVLKELAPR